MIPKKKTLRLILGDQLNENHSWFKHPGEHVSYVLMEIRQETDYVNHHIQKVVAFFAAMRAFAKRLTDRGHHIVYIRLDAPNNRQTFGGNINNLLAHGGFEHFEYLLLPVNMSGKNATAKGPALSTAFTGTFSIAIARRFRKTRVSG